MPGQPVLLAGLAFHAGWVAIAVMTVKSGRGRGQSRALPERDRVLELARKAA